MGFLNRAKNAWNAFKPNKQEYEEETFDYNLGAGTSERPDRPQTRFYNDRTIVTSVYNRIAIDVASIPLRHILVDDTDRYMEDVVSPLNDCFKLEANLDQGPRQFRQDIAMTLFIEGAAAIVPVDTSPNPATNLTFNIYTLRVGKIVQWYPKHVRISLYNEAKGEREEITLEKRFVAIVENPLYAVMNAPNSTLQRLIRKLSLLDTVDEQSSSGKLDLIIQLPYTIKSEARRQQAEQRRKDIEVQLKDSRYGIAYADGTEKITQLNRPAENNLMAQVEYLTAMLYGQLGITEDIMTGTADEKSMLNYFNRTIEPVLESIIEAMQRAFLGQPGTRRKERIRYFRDPFKLVPLGAIAEIADKFTRNEIFSSNEIRGFMGVIPSKDPKADELVNSNMPQPNEEPSSKPKPETEPEN